MPVDPKQASRAGTLLGSLVFALFAGACAYDWDGYDPRLAPPPPIATACEPGETRSCYSGPDGTAGVGLCVAGLETCDGEGQWNDCVNERLPQAEDCDTPDDEDCDGRTNDPEDDCSCVLGSSRDCYDGPNGSDGTGLCESGLQFCDVSGDSTAYGPCVGQILPQHESCATAIDDNCDGVSNDHCAQWSYRYGSTSSDHGLDVALGPNSMLLAGDYAGALDFGGATLPVDGRNGFAVRLNQQGEELWHTVFGGVGSQWTRAIVEDGNGDVLAAGYFETELSVANQMPFTVNGKTDMFVAKLAGDTGLPLWVYVAGGSGDAQALDVIADSNNDVWVSGFFSETVDFGDGKGAVPAFDERDGFILKLTPDGAILGAEVFGNQYKDEARSLVAAPSGGLYVAGIFDEPITIGNNGVELMDESSEDGFLVRLSAGGTYVWGVTLPGLNNDGASAVAVDPNDGSVVVTGHFEETLTVGNTTLQGTLTRDLYVAKFSDNGTPLWVRGTGDDQPQDPYAVVVGEDGTIYVAAAARGNLEFAGELVRTAGQDDMLLLAYDPSGTELWARSFGDQRHQALRGIAVGPGTPLVVAGSCAGSVNFGAGELFVDGGLNDICVAGFQP